MPAELGFGPVLHVLEVHTGKTQAPSFSLRSARPPPHAPARLLASHGRRELLARWPPAPQPGREHLALAQHRGHPGFYQGRRDPGPLSRREGYQGRKGTGSQVVCSARLPQGASGRHRVFPTASPRAGPGVRR